MKKTQRDHISSLDEYEDLTLFANESFDTQDVDLFEFTSVESSPLTRLKSIILSLDWEINDDILQELDDELNRLQAQWQDDKMAEVYLQGLSKIGSYIRAKGAYAHPNSIKLLLTFFYDFEKITSSGQVTDDQITQLLKSDVRKFKILQYQINQSEVDSSTETTTSVEPSQTTEQAAAAPVEEDASKQLKAAILSLDWEVTDESLLQFNDKIAGLHPSMVDNKPAQVLIQGLQALGDYIADERAEAHPEAFILLHSFNEGLEQVLQTGDQRLTQNRIQDLLVDRINRLNNLKMLITNPSGTLVDDQLIDEMVDEVLTPVGTEQTAQQFRQQEHETTAVDGSRTAGFPANHTAKNTAATESTDTLEAEIDDLFSIESVSAMESADVQYPDEVLPPDAIHPIDDELADDLIEAHLSNKRGLMPALSDTDETSGFNEDAEPLDLPTQSDLAEQLDFLFAGTGSKGDVPLSLSALDAAELELAITGEGEPVAALADADEDNPPDTVESALSGVEEPAELDAIAIGIEESETDPNSLEIQNKLDSFFADANEDLEETSAPQPAVDAIEQSLFFSQEGSVQSALADSEEEQGFSEEAEAAALSFTPLDEIEEKLDFFFGAATDDETEGVPAVSDDLRGESLDRLFDEPKAEPAPTPALSGIIPPETVKEEEQTSIAGHSLPNTELEGALDLFFNDAENAKDSETHPTAVDELTSALEASLEELSPPSAAEERQIQLAALGALLPIVVRTPSREKIAESAIMFASLKKAGLSPEHQALAQLLDSAVTMLVRLPTKEGVTTEKLVNYLYEQLLTEHCRPDILAEAIGRFTVWLQQASTIMPVVPTAGDQENAPQLAYTAKELYFELSELRAQIREEFATLRHEMHHHKT